jgi:transposase
MPAKLSKRDSAALDDSLRDNPQLDPNEVAILYSVTYSTIMRRKAILRRIELTGTDNRSKGSCPRIITPKILEYAIALIERNATLYQNEVADFIFMEFGIQLDQPQVSKLLKQAGISHKKLSVQAYQRNQVLISAWTFKMRN